MTLNPPSFVFYTLRKSANEHYISLPGGHEWATGSVLIVDFQRLLGIAGFLQQL
jgi:hypothetical protein